MSRIPLFAMVAAAALAGCNQEDHTITGETPDPMAAELANAAPVVLPPTIVASKTYRCKDNSLLYIDWLSDDKTTTIRADKDGTPIALTAAEPGQPFTAQGYSLTGTADAAAIQVTEPGKSEQSCKA